MSAVGRLGPNSRPIHQHYSIASKSRDAYLNAHANGDATNSGPANVRGRPDVRQVASLAIGSEHGPTVAVGAKRRLQQVDADAVHAVDGLDGDRLTAIKSGEVSERLITLVYGDGPVSHRCRPAKTTSSDQICENAIG